MDVPPDEILISVQRGGSTAEDRLLAEAQRT